LIYRITQSEPTTIDVQVSESDGIPERPRTPRTASRVSSFNKSFSLESGDGSENGSPLLNQFTTVGKGYGRSLAHPTSPSKVLGPQPVYANLAPEPLESDDHSMDFRPPLQTPTSPTAANRESKTPVVTGVGEDNSPRGIPGGVDSLVTGGDTTEVALLSGNSNPGRGLRLSKRQREGKGKDSKAKELSGNGSTPGKRRKA
jgi:hypothetical protein